MLRVIAEQGLKAAARRPSAFLLSRAAALSAHRAPVSCGVVSISRTAVSSVRGGCGGGLFGHVSPGQGCCVRHLCSGGGDMEIAVPNMGDSITEGTIVSWDKAVGDFCEADEDMCQIETDKVTVPVRAPVSGTLVSVAANEGDVVRVGGPLCVLKPGEGSGESPAEDAGEANPEAADAKADDGGAKPAGDAPKRAPAPPPGAAKPAAKSAPAAPAASSSSKPASSSSSSSSAPEAPKPRGTRDETVVQMSRMRKRIAARLKESQNTTAMLTTFQEVDMKPLMDLRAKYKDAFAKKHGVKLGFMSAFLKASATALLEQPAINAVIEGDEVIYRDYVDISVAVATPNGLVVPVVRNVESMSFAEIEKSIAAYGEKARAGKIELEDMAGGTFTVSNGGVYGSLMGTPIINLPQSAILGLHGINKRPVVIQGENGEDEIAIRPMMYLALTYDHRLIDGREAVTFLRSVKNYVEEPARLVMDI